MAPIPMVGEIALRQKASDTKGMLALHPRTCQPQTRSPEKQKALNDNSAPFVFRVLPPSAGNIPDLEIDPAGNGKAVFCKLSTSGGKQQQKILARRDSTAIPNEPSFPV